MYLLDFFFYFCFKSKQIMLEEGGSQTKYGYNMFLLFYTNAQIDWIHSMAVDSVLIRYVSKSIYGTIVDVILCVCVHFHAGASFLFQNLFQQQNKKKIIFTTNKTSVYLTRSLTEFRCVGICVCVCVCSRFFFVYANVLFTNSNTVNTVNRMLAQHRFVSHR